MKKSIIFLLLTLLMAPCRAGADAIILKDGSRIEADMVWEDGNQVKCNLYGGTITYSKDTVAEIIIEKKASPAPTDQAEEAGNAPAEPEDEINNIGIFYETVNEDKAYSIYEEALENKVNNEFELAQRKLEIALSCLPDGSEYMDTVKDELYYHLPMAKAQHYVMNSQPLEAEKALAGVKEYVKDHPDRFQLLQELDQMNTSIKLIKMTYCSKIEMEAKNIAVALMYYFSTASHTHMPDLSELAEYNGGQCWSNTVELKGDPSSAIIIRIADDSTCCSKGKFYEYTIPSNQTPGWGEWK